MVILKSSNVLYFNNQLVWSRIWDFVSYFKKMLSSTILRRSQLWNKFAHNLAKQSVIRN